MRRFQVSIFTEDDQPIAAYNLAPDSACLDDLAQIALSLAFPPSQPVSHKTVQVEIHEIPDNQPELINIIDLG